MRVSRARISGSMLSRLGARWVTMTKAMPGSDGMALNKYSSASTPPAEAPTPTMGNGLSIGSPSRDREETGLPAVGGSRQGYAKALRIQRAFAGLAMRLDSSVRDRSLCVRSIVVRADSISSRSCKISRRVVDQCPRLGHEVAMLGVHRACSLGFERPNKLQRMNGYFGSLVAAKTTLSLLVPARGTPRRERRGDPVVFQ